MLYRKLKPTKVHGYINYMPGFNETFPELKHLSSEELANRFKKLNLVYFTEVQTPVKPWIRFTLPFAIIALLLMVIFSPVAFILTGKWGYGMTDSKSNFMYNWFKALRLH